MITDRLRGINAYNEASTITSIGFAESCLMFQTFMYSVLLHYSVLRLISHLGMIH